MATSARTVVTHMSISITDAIIFHLIEITPLIFLFY